MKRLHFVTLFFLAACSQSPDGSTALGVTGSPVWFMTATPEAITAHYGKQCQSYGFSPGTAKMARCIQDSANGDRTAGRQGLAGGFSQLGQQSDAYAVRKPVHCNTYSNRTTGTATTTCN